MKSTSKNSNLKATDNVKIALDKAESAFEKTKEGGKTLGKGLCEVVGGTSVAVVNLLKAGYEEGAVLLDKILEKNDPEKTTEKEQHKESAKNSGKKILKGGKSVLLGAKDSIKGTIQGIGNAIKSGYHLADAGDKSLGNKVEGSNIQNEKTKKVAKIGAGNLFKALYIGGLATALTFGGKGIVEKSQKDQDKNEEQKEVVITPEENENNEGINPNNTIAINKFDKEKIKEKPIKLEYNEIYPEKELKDMVGMPIGNDAYSIEGRIMRCLRWKCITDAVEDRYGIPHGLLLAMIAQEGLGDPTIINQSKNGTCDGGAGLIHIQAKNAKDFGLTTAPTYNNKMQDFKHGAELQKIKKDNNNDLKEMCKYDDRRNPVLAVDAAARFLISKYDKKNGKDARILALNKYSGRKRTDYASKVLQYRVTIDQYLGEENIPNFTEGVNNVVNDYANSKKGEAIKNATDKFSITIGDKTGQGYVEYLKYYESQSNNYGLQEYKNL